MIWKKLVIAQIETLALPNFRNFCADSCRIPSRSRSKNANASRIPTNANDENTRRDLLTVAKVLTSEFAAVRFSDSKFIARYKSFGHTVRAQM